MRLVVAKAQKLSFPETERVIYKTNPLKMVICQFKFPPILRIDSETPASFQDSLRVEYPLYEENAANQIGLPPEIAKLFGEVSGVPGVREYHFLSEDRVWNVGLTRDFIALSTSKYNRWEEFRTKLSSAQDAFVKQYKPSFFVRVGLRYRDVIKRSDLGLEKTSDWSALLKPHILGELVALGGAQVEQATREVVISLLDKGRVRIKHGLAKVNGSDELCYSIDMDFFAEGKTEVKDVFTKLDYYNRQAGNLFRWCITPELHERLGPTAI